MSDEIAYDTIVECCDGLTASQAIDIIVHLERKFGFSGTTFTRDDVNSEYRSQTDSNMDMPDDFWEAVRLSRTWSRTMPERLTEIGFDMIYNLVYDELFARREDRF